MLITDSMMKLVEQGETDKKIRKKVLGDFLCGTDKPYRILNMEYITIERCIFRNNILSLVFIERWTKNELQSYKNVNTFASQKGKE